LIKDYNLEIHYHPGQANVVADALSMKTYEPKNTQLQEEMAQLNLHIVVNLKTATELYNQH
jgi:hypothetical protein